MVIFVVYFILMLMAAYFTAWLYLVIDHLRTCEHFDWFIFLWALTWPIFAIAYWRTK